MKRLRRGRWAPIARGVLLLAAILLLPLAAMLQAPRESAAQSAGQDSLWAVTQHNSKTSIGVCANPSSPASLSGCFSSATSVWQGEYNQAVATDGVNVYFVGLNGGLSCPIADLGANCTTIMAGGWGSTGQTVSSIAAANGQIWIGQQSGKIYRCPANLPYAKGHTMPSQCVLLDDSGDRPVTSLLLANGRLYVGLYYTGIEQQNQGLLWSCSPDTVNACSTLDSYGHTGAFSLAAGGGYLWAGLGNGIIWRCDLNAANACANWEQSGGDVNSLSYNGQGTLYAAIDAGKGPVWSCPTAYANGCSNVLSNVDGWSVAAGAGSVFSSSYHNELYYGTSQFSASSGFWSDSLLLYLPADGPVGVGGVSMTVEAKAMALSQKLVKRCDKPGRTARATVTVTGPNGFTKTMKVGACDLVKSGAMQHRVDLLDIGPYTVSVQAGKHSGEASFTVEPDRTTRVNLKLTRGFHH
jgi:hypothetical protein